MKKTSIINFSSLYIIPIQPFLCNGQTYTISINRLNLFKGVFLLADSHSVEQFKLVTCIPTLILHAHEIQVLYSYVYNAKDISRE